MEDNTAPATPGGKANFTDNETQLICAIMQNLTSEIQASNPESRTPNPSTVTSTWRGCDQHASQSKSLIHRLHSSTSRKSPSSSATRTAAPCAPAGTLSSAPKSLLVLRRPAELTRALPARKPKPLRRKPKPPRMARTERRPPSRSLWARRLLQRARRLPRVSKLR